MLKNQILCLKLVIYENGAKREGRKNREVFTKLVGIMQIFFFKSMFKNW